MVSRRAPGASRRLTKSRGSFSGGQGSLPSHEGSLFFRWEAYQADREASLAAREAYQVTREAYLSVGKLTKRRGKLLLRTGKLTKSRRKLIFPAMKLTEPPV